VHNFTTLEFIENVTGRRVASVTAMSFGTSAFFTTNVVSVPIWIAALMLVFISCIFAHLGTPSCGRWSPFELLLIFPDVRVFLLLCARPHSLH
jgi:hypothetical protein